MGIFFNRKKKSKSSQQSSTNLNEMTNNDREKYECYTERIINGEYLLGQEWEEYNDLGLKSVLDEQKRSTNPKYHRTKAEEELKSKFLHSNYDLIEEFESIMTPIKNKSASQLKKEIELFDRYQEIFYSKGEGGKLYFQDMWEHCHNSQNECFSWRERLEEEYNRLKSEEELYRLIPQVILSNENLLQKDIYTHLPEYKKGLIQSTIRTLEKNNVIIRTKQKGSYLLELNE